MFERREVRANPCQLILTAVLMFATAIFVPLSIKGVVSMPTHCSEFRLDDPYINWPVLAEQVNHKKELAVFGFLTLVILVIFAMCRPTRVNQVLVNLGDRLWYIFDMKLYRLMNTGYYILLGYLMCLVFLGFVKHSAGELRPCFIDMCKPNLTLVHQITSGDARALLNRDVCTNTDLDYFCMSFFSGHTLSAFYAATTCCLLLFFMDLPSRHRLFSVRFLVGILMISAAAWVAFTRLQDHYHHVVDVVAAAGMGILAPLFMMVVPLRRFREDETGVKCGEVGPLLGAHATNGKDLY